MAERELQLRDLRARRRSAGMRSAEMARRLGFDVGTFAALEHGDLWPSAELLQEWEREIERAEAERDQRRKRPSLSRILDTMLK